MFAHLQYSTKVQNNIDGHSHILHEAQEYLRGMTFQLGLKRMSYCWRVKEQIAAIFWAEETKKIAVTASKALQKASDTLKALIVDRVAAETWSEGKDAEDRAIRAAMDAKDQARLAVMEALKVSVDANVLVLKARARVAMDLELFSELKAMVADAKNGVEIAKAKIRASSCGMQLKKMPHLEAEAATAIVKFARLL